MKILEQTSTHLILEDSSEGIWISKLLTAIFLIMGAAYVLTAIVNQSFFSLFTVISIIFLFGGGTGLAFFPYKNTVYFDQTTQKLIIIQESPLRTKQLEYNLSEILDVIVEQDHQDEEGIFYYTLTLRLASQIQRLSISCTTFADETQVKEMANVIRTFLGCS